MNVLNKLPAVAAVAAVTSLAERRRQEQNRIVQTLKPLEIRVQELETDQLRLIDLALDQENQLADYQTRIEKLENRLLQLISLLAKN